MHNLNLILEANKLLWKIKGVALALLIILIGLWA